MLRANTSFLKVVHILGTDHQLKVEDTRLLPFFVQKYGGRKMGNRVGRVFLVLGLTFCCFVGVAAIASALDIVLEPANAQRKVGGKVRVHLYADNAESLLSMGVKVSFNPAIVQAVSVEKYAVNSDTGWVMDGDGDPSTTTDQYRTPDVEIDNTNGSVVMIGGNLKGTSTTGLSGKVLLGWIVFNAVGKGVSNLNVDVAKYHPNHPTSTFDNFVKVGGTVDEPTNVPANMGVVCVAANVCEGNYEGSDTDVDRRDRAIFNSAYGSLYPAPEYDWRCDFDGDGDVDRGDRKIFNKDYGRVDCPLCP